jgi:hypothetical protein
VLAAIRLVAAPAIIVLTLSSGVGAVARAQSDVTFPEAVDDLRLGGPTRYVDRSHPQASDTGPGTASTPWRTILHAVKTARAGETVLIKRGTYPENESGRVEVANSGTETSPITFSAYPGDERQVVISGASFRIHGRSHIVVRGLKVTGAYTTSTSRGFSIQGPGTNIALLGNETDGTRSSGIGVWGVSFNTDPTDYQHLFNIVLDHNLIQRACDGGYDECITVANGVHDIRVSNNEITAPGDTALGGEGIDFKEGVFGGVVSGNYVHDMIKVAIYMDAAGVAIGPGGVEDIAISGNRVRNISNGEGIELGTEGRGNLKNLQVVNNTIQGVAKNGITLYAHPSGTGTATGITFMNNTSYDNVRYGVRVSFPSTRASGVLVRNNISYSNGYGDYSVASGASATADHNLWGIDPRFMNPTAGDLRLSVGSPAADVGSPTGAPANDLAGVARPQGPAFDIGAFERVP